MGGEEGRFRGGGGVVTRKEDLEGKTSSGTRVGLYLLGPS